MEVFKYVENICKIIRAPLRQIYGVKQFYVYLMYKSMTYNLNQTDIKFQQHQILYLQLIVNQNIQEIISQTHASLFQTITHQLFKYCRLECLWCQLGQYTHCYLNFDIRLPHQSLQKEIHCFRNHLELFLYDYIDFIQTELHSQNFDSQLHYLLQDQNKKQSKYQFLNFFYYFDWICLRIIVQLKLRLLENLCFCLFMNFDLNIKFTIEMIEVEAEAVEMTESVELTEVVEISFHQNLHFLLQFKLIFSFVIERQVRIEVCSIIFADFDQLYALWEKYLSFNFQLLHLIFYWNYQQHCLMNLFLLEKQIQKIFIEDQLAKVNQNLILHFLVQQLHFLFLQYDFPSLLQYFINQQEHQNLLLLHQCFLQFDCLCLLFYYFFHQPDYWSRNRQDYLSHLKYQSLQQMQEKDQQLQKELQLMRYLFSWDRDKRSLIIFRIRIIYRIEQKINNIKFNQLFYTEQLILQRIKLQQICEYYKQTLILYCFFYKRPASF